MKRLLISTLFVLISLTFSQSQDNSNQQTEIQAEFDTVVKAYKQGNYAEAQQHAEKALSLDPTNKKAMIFVARTIHAQYIPANESPENRAKAYEAITAYRRILANEPTNEEAYLAITALYGAVREEELQRWWVYQWANNPSAGAKQRAKAFVLLASWNWNCAYQIALLSKQTKGTKVIWVKPEDQNDFEKAKRCAVEGMNQIEQAITLDPENELVWTYKANLLRERAKLAEMEGNKRQSKEFHKQADAAQEKANKLPQNNRRMQEEAPPNKPIK